MERPFAPALLPFAGACPGNVHHSLVIYGDGDVFDFLRKGMVRSAQDYMPAGYHLDAAHRGLACVHEHHQGKVKIEAPLEHADQLYFPDYAVYVRVPVHESERTGCSHELGYRVRDAFYRPFVQGFETLRFRPRNLHRCKLGKPFLCLDKRFGLLPLQHVIREGLIVERIGQDDPVHVLDAVGKLPVLVHADRFHLRRRDARTRGGFSRQGVQLLVVYAPRRCVGKHDIKAHQPGAHVGERLEPFPVDVARPGELSDRGQAVLVNVEKIEPVPFLYRRTK